MLKRKSHSQSADWLKGALLRKGRRAARFGQATERGHGLGNIGPTVNTKDYLFTVSSGNALLGLLQSTIQTLFYVYVLAKEHAALQRARGYPVVSLQESE